MLVKLHSIPSKIRKLFAVILLAGFSANPAPATEPLPSLPDIVERAIARDEASQQALKTMQYHETLSTQQLDDQGKVTKEQLAQLMIRPGASPDMQVLSTQGDDIPTNPDEAAEQAKGKEEQRKQVSLSLKDMAVRFSLKLTGQELLNNNPVYVVAFEPKADQPFKNQTEKVLNHLRGKVWISARDYALVKTEATLAEPVEVAWVFASIVQLDFHYQLDDQLAGLGPCQVQTFVKVQAPFITIRQKMSVVMDHFEPRSNLTVSTTAGNGVLRPQ